MSQLYHIKADSKNSKWNWKLSRTSWFSWSDRNGFWFKKSGFQKAGLCAFKRHENRRTPIRSDGVNGLQKVGPVISILKTATCPKNLLRHFQRKTTWGKSGYLFNFFFLDHQNIYLKFFFARPEMQYFWRVSSILTKNAKIHKKQFCIMYFDQNSVLQKSFV